MTFALLAALLLEVSVLGTEVAPHEYEDWLKLAPGLVAPFRLSADEPGVDGVALGTPGAPMLLVTAFDRQIAEPWVRAMVERVRDEPAARSLLEKLYIVVLPALAREGGDPARFGVDFPLGWQPGSLRPGAAEVPLASEETRDLAEWLLDREELVAVLALDGPDRAAPEQTTDLPEILLRLTHLAPVENEFDGGWLDYARGALGLSTLTPRSSSQPAAGVRELFELVRQRARVEVALIEARPLAVGLWQVDLALDNVGAFPTHAFGAGDPRVPPLMTEVRGVRAIAIARRPGEVGSFSVGHMRTGPWPEPALEAHGRRTVRLVVELDGESGRMEFETGTPRLGRAQLVLELRPLDPKSPAPPARGRSTGSRPVEKSATEPTDATPTERTALEAPGDAD